MVLLVEDSAPLRRRQTRHEQKDTRSRARLSVTFILSANAVSWSLDANCRSCTRQLADTKRSEYEGGECWTRQCIHTCEPHMVLLRTLLRQPRPSVEVRRQSAPDRIRLHSEESDRRFSAHSHLHFEIQRCLRVHTPRRSLCRRALSIRLALAVLRGNCQLRQLTWGPPNMNTKQGCHR